MSSKKDAGSYRNIVKEGFNSIPTPQIVNTESVWLIQT